MPNANYINLKNISDDLQKAVFYHKQINSYGLGDTDQMSYWTQLRLKQDNPTFESPFFPLLYVVPSKVTNGLRYKEWELNCVMSDIVSRGLENQVDVLSDTLQMLQDIMSQFRLSVNPALGCFNEYYYLDESINFTPFLEKYSDLTNGWNALLKIKTMTPLDRCAAAYQTFTGSPIIHDTVNFKTFHDDFRLLADHHKQINSFGFGDLEDLSFETESRLKQDNPTAESPFFPLLYVVPGDAQQVITDNGSSYTEFTFNCIVMDILDRDLINQVDVLSDTNQILDDIISQFRLSVDQSLGCFNAKYYLDDAVECFPFMEKYTDLCGGWNGVLRVKVMTPLDRCAAAFNSFLSPTPSPTVTITPTFTQTPTITPTFTQTPTITPTITCPITTQYLEVQLSDNTKFKLILWNQPDFTSAANALCDYVISGCAYGSLGTVFCADETINSGQHQHQFNLAPVLLPGETVTGFTVDSYYTVGCVCPVNLVLPIPPSPTPTNTPSPTPSYTPTLTPTPSITPSLTVTPSETPTNTPSETPTNTPSVTPTLTPTSSPIPIVWNTNANDWDDEATNWDVA